MNSTVEQKFIETCYLLNEKIVVLRFPTTWCVPLYCIALLCSAVLLFFSIFLNGITVSTIWNSRRLKEKVAFFTILIQSIADLSNGVILIPLSIVHFAGDFVGRQSCVYLYASRKIRFLLLFYSMTTMSAMCFERYMGIRRPFVHRAEVTKARVLKCVLFVCCFQTLLYSVGFLNGIKMAKPFFSVNTLLFLALLTLTYASIFRVRIKKMNSDIGAQGVGVVGVENRNTKRRLMKELKIAKSCFLVVVSNLVCFIPAVMLVGVLPLKTCSLLVTLKRWSYILMMFNPTANSLIFFWSNKTLRVEGLSHLRNFFNRIRRKDNNIMAANS